MLMLQYHSYFDVHLDVTVSASPLGQEKCSWGPSYWCESYKQAVECKALEHCRTKVWAVKNEVMFYKTSSVMHWTFKFSVLHLWTI